MHFAFQQRMEELVKVIVDALCWCLNAAENPLLDIRVSFI